MFKFSLIAALTLVAAEIGVRLLLPRPGFVAFPVAEMDGVFRQDADRGYAYSPNLSRRVVTPDYTIDFQTNSLGMRDDPVDARPLPGAIRVLAIGDSYTQGHGVAADQAWPKRLEALLEGSRVYNAGVSGYSMAQMHTTARLLLPELRPNLLVVGLYAYGHYRMRDPFVLVGNGAGLIARSWAGNVVVVQGGLLASNFSRPLFRRVDLFLAQHWRTGAYLLQLAGQGWHALSGEAVRLPPTPLPLAEEMEPMLQELLACQRLADSAGIPMLVLLINPQEKDGTYSQRQHEYNAIVSRFAAGYGIRLIDPLPRLVALAAGRPVFRLNTDRHWSAAAHMIAAEEAAREAQLLLHQ